MSKLTRKDIEKLLQIMFDDEYVGNFNGDGDGRWCGFTGTYNGEYLAEVYEADMIQVFITVHGEFKAMGDTPNILAAYYHGLIDGIHPCSFYKELKKEDELLELEFEWDDEEEDDDALT